MTGSGHGRNSGENFIQQRTQSTGDRFKICRATGGNFIQVLLWKRLCDIEARKRLAVDLFLYHSKYKIKNIYDLKTNFLSDRCKVIKINVISVCIQIRGFDNLYKIFLLILGQFYCCETFMISQTCRSRFRSYIVMI